MKYFNFHLQNTSKNIKDYIAIKNKIILNCHCKVSFIQIFVGAGIEQLVQNYDIYFPRLCIVLELLLQSIHCIIIVIAKHIEFTGVKTGTLELRKSAEINILHITGSFATKNEEDKSLTAEAITTNSLQTIVLWPAKASTVPRFAIWKNIIVLKLYLKAGKKTHFPIKISLHVVSHPLFLCGKIKFYFSSLVVDIFIYKFRNKKQLVEIKIINKSKNNLKC
ncbi:Protein of unknown function [Gryllus bimaculatus]|nr:Protein of unknown function [Gryllus bimaculatus]